jgi:hypothetical protein
MSLKNVDSDGVSLLIGMPILCISFNLNIIRLTFTSYIAKAENDNKDK